MPWSKSVVDAFDWKWLKGQTQKPAIPDSIKWRSLGSLPSLSELYCVDRAWCGVSETTSSWSSSSISTFLHSVSQEYFFQIFDSISERTPSDTSALPAGCSGGWPFPCNVYIDELCNGVFNPIKECITSLLAFYLWRNKDPLGLEFVWNRKKKHSTCMRPLVLWWDPEGDKASRHAMMCLCT